MSESEPGYGSVSENQDGKTSDENPSTDDVPDTCRTRCSPCCSDCKVNRKMLPVKLFYFAFFGSRGAVTPYFSIYFKQLGLSPDQIGLASGMRPVVGFCAGPVWGAAADKFKIRKLCLILSMIGWLFFTLGLGFVPQPKKTPYCPNIVNETKHPYKRSVKMFEMDARSISQPVAAPPIAAPTVIPESSKSTTRKLLYHVFEPTFIHHLKKKFNKSKGHHHRRHHRHRHDTYYEKEMRENLSWLYEESSLSRVVIILLLLTIFGEVVQSPTSALADAATLEMLGPENVALYGHQRAWGAVGFGFSSFLVGLLLSYSRNSVKICGILLVFSDYMIPFYVFAAEMSMAFLCACSMDYRDGRWSDRSYSDAFGTAMAMFSGQSSDKAEEKKEESGVHNTADVFKLFMSIHYASWLSTSYFMGVCNGVIWGFLYWHLENLGASQLLLGVVGILTYACEFIMFFFVDKLIKPFGYIGTLYIALVCYAVRFAIYAFIKNPWFVIPAELLQGLTFSSVWTCLTRYACSAVPRASLATVQGILHGVYWGLGAGTGHLAGGLFIVNFGARATFIGLAICCLLTLMLFAVAQKFSVKPAPLRGAAGGYMLDDEPEKEKDEGTEEDR